MSACVGLVGAGCAGPARGFASADPGARLDAAVEATARKDTSAIPDLIKLLESDDPAARLVAINALERLTGTTNGYDFAAPEYDRRAAVDRWVAWAGEHHDSGAKRD
jgi:HEAT repeat protein